MKVLIADDDSTTRLVLTSLVRRMGHQPVAAMDGHEAWQQSQRLQQGKEPYLMLVDWEMPKLNGIQLCQRVKNQGLLNPPYMILITSRTDADDIVEGLEQGADDYICKPYNAAELIARIQVARRTLDLNHELYKVREELKYQASHDELTGLLNRRAVIQALERELNRAQRQGNQMHIALCDIDYFKRINDTHGHLVGDMVLKALAGRMQEQLRPYDLIARIGGEEFLIALNGTLSNAREVIERLRASIAEKPLVVTDEYMIRLTVSIGITSTEDCPQEPTIEYLMIRADTLLYEAKRAGRDRVIGEQPSLAEIPDKN